MPRADRDAQEYMFLHRVNEKDWSALPRAFLAGERVYRFHGHTYGLDRDDAMYLGEETIPCTQKPGEEHFFTVPVRFLVSTATGQRPSGAYMVAARPLDGPTPRKADTTPAKVDAGRLAMEYQGPWWVAYYAPEQTSMVGAFEIARITTLAVYGPSNAPRKAAFMSLVQECVGDIIEATTGIRPTWPTPPTPAPERERAGHS